MNLKPINKKEIQGKVKVFFRSQRWKNTLIFLGFIALASFFWALQYFRQKFEFEVPIKVYYVHIPTGIALSNELPQEITLQVQDKGSAYLHYMIKKKKQSLSISVDLEAISINNTYYVIDRSVLYALIEKKMFTTTQITSFFPDKIEINYSPLKSKELPVAINGTISPASGYLFSDSIQINPAQVVVYGNKNALDTLHEIRTLPLNYKDINKDWTVYVDLQVPEGIQLLTGQVKLSAVVEEYTEKTFELPVICYNVPTDRNVHFFPSLVELDVKVGLSKYAYLSKSDFEIAIDYNDLKNKNTANYSLTLTQKPAWLESYRIVPDVIEFLIEQKSD